MKLKMLLIKSQDEYATMKKNAEEVGEKLRSGFYTKKIMKEC